MNTVVVVLILLGLVGGLNGHAVLKSPVPFNPSPTTTSKCGVNTITQAMSSTAQATWEVNKAANIEWYLQASDGGGNLIGEFDPLGGTNFTVPAWTDIYPTSGSNTYYPKTFFVPATLDCSKAPNGLCTFRVRSGSWVSCTMVKICTTDCNAPPPPPQVCQKPTSPLTFCTNISGSFVAKGYSVNDLDNTLSGAYTSNLAKPLVFETPTAECQTLYKTLICAYSFPSCDPVTGAKNGVSACKSQCKQTMKACSVTDIHKTLYDCDSLPECNGKLSGGSGSSGMSSGGAAALSIFLIVLVAGVAVSGYVYHKQGHLFGYKVDLGSKKVVKVQQDNAHNYTAFQDNDYKI